MHRFVWPLRYPAPPALAKGNTFADGVWAPPGRYIVELSADGQRLRRPLVVEPDPRVALPPEAYGRQFALARRVEQAREAAAVAMAEAETLHKQIVARAAAAPPESPSSRAMAGLDAEAHALSEREEPGPRSFPPPPKTVSSLRFLEGALATLASAVDGADADPTPDARAGFAQLESTLAKTLASWDALKSGSLAALNAKLRQAGEPPLVP